ncbi:hypothetical protein [Haloquadratum walsbyi]|uniref:hypothetical protein n=1 Tax=Haloquadratum walsbyi TaxID=293091 RepID=UPI00064EA7F0|nr:hypothetical protein [Haloquadratum walsbyi]
MSTSNSSLLMSHVDVGGEVYQVTGIDSDVLFFALVHLYLIQSRCTHFCAPNIDLLKIRTRKISVRKISI